MTDEFRHLSCEHLDANRVGWIAECASPVDDEGELVDVERIPRAEWGDELWYCGAFDASRLYDDEGQPDDGWRCPICGGAVSHLTAVYLVSKIERVPPAV